MAVRILLVEDNVDNHRLIRAFLKKTPWQVDVAEDGARGVTRFTESGPYDLVLMDMHMPVMDGYAATRAIRAWERAHGVAATPIIAFTASEDEWDTRQSREAGCVGHLSKPVGKAALLASITAYVGQDASAETPS